MNKRISVGVIIACSVLRGSAAWAGDPGVTDNEVVIGSHTNESGTLSIYAPFPKTISAYFDRLNEKGGVFGRKIKFLRIDTQAKVPATVQATKKLVEEDNIFAMFAAMPPVHQSVYKYLLEKGVPDVFFQDGLREYTQPQKKTVFPGLIAYSTESHIYGERMIRDYQGKRVCFFIPNQAFGEEYLAGVMAAIEEGNRKLSDNKKVKIGDIERVDPSAPQANEQVLKLKRDNCDVVLNGTYSALAPNVIAYGVSQGFKPVWMVMLFNSNAKFIELLPPEARDLVIGVSSTVVSGDGNPPGWGDYEKLVNDSKLPINRSTIVGYVLAQAFDEALRRAGKDLTRDKLVSALETMHDWKCTLCLVPIGLTPTNHAMFSDAAFLKIKDGKWVRM